MSSPWGKVQSSTSLMRGVREVSTSGHGGIMVTKKFADENLSEAAVKRGIPYGNYVCFEEDCDAAMVVWEIPEIWHLFNPNKAEIKNSLIENLSAFNPDYLREMGIEPVIPKDRRKEAM